jgi:hypothetical protein
MRSRLNLRDLGLLFDATVSGGFAKTPTTPSLGPEEASVPVCIVKAGSLTVVVEALG